MAKCFKATCFAAFTRLFIYLTGDSRITKEYFMKYTKYIF